MGRSTLARRVMTSSSSSSDAPPCRPAVAAFNFLQSVFQLGATDVKQRGLNSNSLLHASIGPAPKRENCSRTLIRATRDVRWSEKSPWRAHPLRVDFRHPSAKNEDAFNLIFSLRVIFDLRTSVSFDPEELSPLKPALRAPLSSEQRD